MFVLLKDKAAEMKRLQTSPPEILQETAVNARYPGPSLCGKSRAQLVRSARGRKKNSNHGGKTKEEMI